MTIKCFNCLLLPYTCLLLLPPFVAKSLAGSAQCRWRPPFSSSELSSMLLVPTFRCSLPAAFALVPGSGLETPTSLIERGRTEEGLRVLKKIRGVEDVEKEYDEILRATETAKQVKNPFRNLMKRSSIPQLFCGTILQVFQQFTGINVIMFYAPVLFQTMGLGGDASLLSAVVTGSINSAATLVAIFGVDRVGRRFLLIEAAFQMLISHCFTGAILARHLKSTNVISKHYAYIVVILICVFVSGFAWSWGPLGWLIPSEIFPLETRTAGFFFAVSMNMICTFVIAQAFLTMLCHMRSSIFFFFAAWIVVMGAFAAFLLPETKGIPIDEMNGVWKKHWFWHRFFRAEDDGNSCVEKELKIKVPKQDP